jgi:hypothetical protein
MMYGIFTTIEELGIDFEMLVGDIVFKSEAEALVEANKLNVRFPLNNKYVKRLDIF